MFNLYYLTILLVFKNRLEVYIYIQSTFKQTNQLFPKAKKKNKRLVHVSTDSHKFPHTINSLFLSKCWPNSHFLELNYCLTTDFIQKRFCPPSAFSFSVRCTHKIKIPEPNTAFHFLFSNPTEPNRTEKPRFPRLFYNHHTPTHKLETSDLLIQTRNALLFKAFFSLQIYLICLLWLTLKLLS